LSIYWVAVLSFLMGVCGYIIVRFWIIPIGRYRRAKGRLRQRLDAFWRLLPADDTAKPKAAGVKKTLREIRRGGVELMALHDEELPYWYRLALMTRRESPRDAVEPILCLENLSASGQARQCVQEIAHHFGFKAFDR